MPSTKKHKMIGNYKSLNKKYYNIWSGVNIIRLKSSLKIEFKQGIFSERSGFATNDQSVGHWDNRMS